MTIRTKYRPNPRTGGCRRKNFDIDKAICIAGPIAKPTRRPVCRRKRALSDLAILSIMLCIAVAVAVIGLALLNERLQGIYH